MKEGNGREVRRSSGHSNAPAIQVICLGSGGGPSEDNVTGFLARSTATQWSKNSVIAVDAGTHLAAITRMLEQDFPLVSDDPDLRFSPPLHGDDSNGRAAAPQSLEPASVSDDESGVGTPVSEREVPVTITTLKHGAFAGLPFPYASARANALHIVREHISTYLITHPHLDHISGFVINTAAFHNTSRPKRLAALPFTVNAIKTHIFNNVIWPNLTDEDGGVGLVTFQRLAEGGNIALGEGSGRGFIEVCDGLGVKGFKVSHGHCMNVPAAVHRGSNVAVPETPGLAHTATPQHHMPNPDAREARSLSFSLPTQSAPGTPMFNLPDPGRRASGPAVLAHDTRVVDSSAYFIRADSTLTTPKREVLIFGDVEPDSISLNPRTAHIWAEAAPKIAAGILTGIFIEVSFTNAQGDAVLFGHLAPRHLLVELGALADMVREARRELEREREAARLGRKRKRVSSGLGIDGGAGTTVGADAGPHAHRKAKTVHLGPVAAKPVDSPLAGPALDDHVLPDAPDAPLSRTDTGAGTGTHTPLPIPPLSHSHANHFSPTTRDLTPDHHSKALLSAAFDNAPLKGVKVVVIHVKDTFTDGPLVGKQILRELREGEEGLREKGKGLGCGFEVSRGGESYWF